MTNSTTNPAGLPEGWRLTEWCSPASPAVTNGKVEVCLDKKSGEIEVETSVTSGGHYGVDQIVLVNLPLAVVNFLAKETSC